RADHLGKIARGYRDLAEDPESHGYRPRVVIPARLREVASAGNAEAHGEGLQQDRHQVGDENHAQERVTVARAAREVGGPVPGVHVADGDEIAGTRKRKQLSPEASILRNRNRAVHLAKASLPAGQPPPAGPDLGEFGRHFEWSE